MLIERLLPLALTGIAAALIVPEIARLLSQTNTDPTPVTVVAATVLGSAGINMGTAISSTYSFRASRVMVFVIWGILALSLSIGVGFCFTRAFEISHKVMFLGGIVLPLVAFLVELISHFRES